ncbi:DUF5819 family protein [Hymenobacter sp. H14-R3]|uniref:DUF5819 family protein n=1 Tax=Hymenobacter sp. H14-R3 TaxID=3046308 RepID=UPI0024BA0454|nr:DUF5819 family protein [Hymenobacter sp. H14-R3]MDJ0367126.1 DUF5819 family protein [Hymenobacter sp. H14-R3]
MKTAINLFFGTLLAAHFLVIAFSLLPDNPIKHQYKYEMARYTTPLFQQNWNLFAPNPVSSNWTVKYQYQVYRHGQLYTTSWLDVVTPLVYAKRTSFWSPVQRVLKHMSSGIMDIMEFNRKFKELTAENDTLKNNPAKLDRFYGRALRECSGHNALVQYSQFVYARMALPAAFQSPDSVAFRYDIQCAYFPRFSKRNLDYFDTKNYTYSQIMSRRYTLLTTRPAH